jgi:hypothetical protein
VYDYEFGIMPNDSICYGEEIILNASGGVVYDWEPKSSLENSNTANPVASPDSTTTYAVRIQDTNGCEWEIRWKLKLSLRSPLIFPISKNMIAIKGH